VGGTAHMKDLVSKVLLVFTALDVPLSALLNNLVDMIRTDSPASQILLPASHLIVQQSLVWFWHSNTCRHISLESQCVVKALAIIFRWTRHDSLLG